MLRRDFNADNYQEHQEILPCSKYMDIFHVETRSDVPHDWCGWVVYICGMRSSIFSRARYNDGNPIPVVGCVTQDERDKLNSAIGPSAKMGLATLWLSNFITCSINNGSFGNTPPPVLSRLYQQISDGMLGFNQAKKLAYLPFPFVYAQSTELLMLLLMILIPLLMQGFVIGTGLGLFLTFVSTISFFSLYEATRELEDPFIYEPNDLPLLSWQSGFNENMISLTKYNKMSN